MATRKMAGPFKNFTNLGEVLDGMLELGFFGGHQALRDEAEHNILNYNLFDPEQTGEYWYSNGVIELKIFRQLFDVYELCNYRRQIHEDLDTLFELAELKREPARG